MHQRRAVKSRTGGDVVAPGQGVCQRGGFAARQVERDGRHVVAGIATVHRDARNLRQARHKMRAQRGQALMDGVDPLRADKARTLRKAGQAMTVQRARLQVLGPRDGLVLLVGEHARAAEEERLDIDPRAGDQAARARGTHQRLVTGEAQHVRAHGLHVHGIGARSLRGVHQQQRAGCMGDAGDALDIHHVARKIGRMRAAHQPRALDNTF